MTPNTHNSRHIAFKTLVYTALIFVLLLAIRLSWGYVAYARFQTTITRSGR